MNKFYNKKCPKCGTTMVQEIRYNNFGNSYLIWKCLNSKCNKEVKYADYKYIA